MRLTICDDDPLALQRLITPVSVVTTAEAVIHIADYALVVTSPGFAPTTPVLAAAASPVSRSGVTSNWHGAWTKRAGSAPPSAGWW